MNYIKDDPYVLVTGAFDVVHLGHIRLLEYARSFSLTKVIVMIDVDERIREAKGHERPFNCFQDREEFLHSLKYVDYVLPIVTDSDIVTACKQYKPIRIVGGDWKGKLIIGANACQEVRFFDRIKGYSTTRILNGK
jgi:cytidyltransferase-like protein